MENKYQNSKIYKLECSDGYYYYGTTIQKYLSQRLTTHKTDSILPKFKNNKLYKHINTIGWNNVKIILVELYPCSSKDELRMKENEYINKSLSDNLCLNKNRAYRSDDEIILQTKLYREQKQYKKNTIIKCECGIEHTVGRTQQHLNSVKHKSLMES